ncbi:hypothetical protein MUK42_03018 [Musa troglodytarum]|uniref:Uncharacterized protein n=1 Tax=Musa troglodytarum TaxID=320322 RepID=A0A9E7G5S4_9LILI|nr:hypothetical protein MUK42_03018 [Musa troglodytarum]
MEKKDSSTDGESSTVSPDVQAFFDLVDREGRRRRLELLNEKKEEASSGKRPANKVVPWQPKFEMEDFELSSERVVEFGSAKPCYEGDDGCLGRGIKRKSELTPPPSIHKKYDSRRFEFDLNTTDDSL